VLQYGASLANSYEGRYEVLYGTNAAIKLAWSHGWMFKEADAPTQGWEVYANRQQFHNDEGITLIADATQLASQGKLKEGVGLPHPSAYYAVSDFLRACAGGGAVPVTAEDALAATAVGIAAHEAVKSGRTVEITQEMVTA
jgi:predicted dehydrogenase